MLHTCAITAAAEHEHGAHDWIGTAAPGVSRMTEDARRPKLPLTPFYAP